jgi:hypothetical protein
MSGSLCIRSPSDVSYGRVELRRNLWVPSFEVISIQAAWPWYPKPPVSIVTAP